MSKKAMIGGFLSMSILMATLAPTAQAFWPFDGLFSKGEVKAAKSKNKDKEERKQDNNGLKDIVTDQLSFPPQLRVSVSCDFSPLIALQEMKARYEAYKIKKMKGAPEMLAAISNVEKKCEELRKVNEDFKMIQARYFREPEAEMSDPRVQLDDPKTRPSQIPEIIPSKKRSIFQILRDRTSPPEVTEPSSDGVIDGGG